MTLLDYGVQKVSHRSFQRVHISQVRRHFCDRIAHSLSLDGYQVDSSCTVSSEQGYTGLQQTRWMCTLFGSLKKGEEDGLYLKVEGFQPDKDKTLFLSRLGDTIGHSSVAR
jgi:hypothetical protein